MSDADSEQAPLLHRFGKAYHFDAFVTGIVFLKTGHVAYALGDGTIRFIDLTKQQEILSHQVHQGACLSMVASPDRSAILSGGDDGRLVRSHLTGIQVLTEISGKWIDHLAVTPLPASPGFYALATAKTVQIYDDNHQQITSLDHPATVGGIAFDDKGSRLAVAHYGGATIWRRDGRRWVSSRLVWSGSHTSIMFSPDGKYVITTMQEAALHGWRLFDKTDMRMTGYPAKVKSMAFTAGGTHLVTSGADRPVCWPFVGAKGPMGQKPLQLGSGLDNLTTQVAAHSQHPVVASGYRNGAILLDLVDRDGTISVRNDDAGGAITALDFSPDGQFLAFGTEDGVAGLVTLPN